MRFNVIKSGDINICSFIFFGFLSYFTVLVIWNVILHRLMLVRNGLVTRGDTVEVMHVGVHFV